MPTADLLFHPRTSPDFASRFSAALLSPETATPPLITGPRGKRADKRYGVYRNNVTVSLIAALASIFPAVERITGSDFFRAMARFHVRETPPTSPLLFEYGRDFPAFIGRYEYAQDMPWLSDVARIERLWLDSYHAADAPSLAADALLSVPVKTLGSLVFRSHPATRLISSAHPAVTVFAMNRGAGPTGRVENRPEDGLITRLGDEVTVQLLAPGTAAFLRILIGGQCLAMAVAAAFEIDPAFDLPGAIGGMIASGAFSHLEKGNSDVDHA